MTALLNLSVRLRMISALLILVRMMFSQINRQQTRRTTPLTIPSPISSTYLADWLLLLKKLTVMLQ